MATFPPGMARIFNEGSSVRDLAVAIISAAILGVAVGSLVQPKAAVAQPTGWSAQASVGDEDPNVLLYRAAMGGDSPTAPQPYVPVPAVTQEIDWTYAEDGASALPVTWSGEAQPASQPSPAESLTTAPAPAIADATGDPAKVVHDVAYQRQTLQSPGPAPLPSEAAAAPSTASVSP